MSEYGTKNQSYIRCGQITHALKETQGGLLALLI
jgi:hypothetical protein